jgi:hypothetical protein
VNQKSFVKVSQLLSSSALQAEAEGRGSVQEKDPETSIRPAEEPATGTSQGNLGLSQDAALPDATVQVHHTCTQLL